MRNFLLVLCALSAAFFSTACRSGDGGGGGGGDGDISQLLPILLIGGAGSDSGSGGHLVAPPAFTLRYHSEGHTSGTVPVDSRSPYQQGASVQVLGQGTLEYTGNLFTGWDTARDGTGTRYQPGNRFNMPAANVTLYAQWANAGVITFDTNGGSYIAPMTVAIGDPIVAPANPTRTGHTFTGWDPPLPATMEVASLTVTAQWQVNQYTITFDSAGGSPVAPITLNYGATITPPPAPTRDGFNFVGWNPSLPSTMPANNISVTAVWVDAELETSRITFLDAPGGHEIAVIEQEVGTPVTAPDDPTRTGYTFTGWDPAVPTHMPEDDVTIVAQWAANTYTVVYDANGGSGTIASSTHTYDVAQNLTSNGFTRTGYTFSGWNTVAGGGGTSYTDGQSVSNLTAVDGATVTLYAQWTANTYTVVYNSNGGSGTTASSTHTYDVAQNLTSNGFTRANYTFSGWNTVAGGGGTSYTDGASVINLTAVDGATVTLYAQWEEDTSEPFTISGTVEDGGSPVAGVTVRLEKDEDGSWENVEGKSPTTTDEGGNFSFTDLTGNVEEYRVIVEGSDP